MFILHSMYYNKRTSTWDAKIWTTIHRPQWSNLVERRTSPFQFVWSSRPVWWWASSQNDWGEFHQECPWTTAWRQSHFVQFWRPICKNQQYTKLWFTYRWAFGFNPATCCMFLVSWPCNNWSLLDADSSTGVRHAREPSVDPVYQSLSHEGLQSNWSYIPHISLDWGIIGSSFVRRATRAEARYSHCPWNSVRSNKFWPFLDSGSNEVSMWEDFQERWTWPKSYP